MNNWLEPFKNLSTRERGLIAAAIGCVFLYVVYLSYDSLSESFVIEGNQVAVKTEELEKVQRQLLRYAYLSSRLKTLEGRFTSSNTSIDNMYAEIDNVVKKSIGNNGYDLKKNPNTETIGEDIEQQGFTLRIKSLGLEQSIKLLYGFENNASHILLNKIDFAKSSDGKELAVTLDLSIIKKKG